MPIEAWILTATMLEHLPHELTLLTLSWLDLASLRQLRLVSKSWLAFTHQYSETIYKGAAVLHGFALHGAQLEAARGGYATAWLEDTVTWEDYCRRFKTLDRAWRGDWNPPAMRNITATWPLAHRFKVVQDDQVLLVTLGRSRGGRMFHANPVGHLLAVDIKEDRVLWALPRHRVRPYAHCEYDAGFLVFDRQNNALEVWRRKADVDRDPLPEVPAAARPDDHMLNASSEAYPCTDTDESSTRGVFVPHALLYTSEPSWAFHLVGTTLVVASQIGRKAFLFDVARGELLSTLDLIGEWDGINYVDLDPARGRVFVATNTGLYAYEKDPRGQNTLLVADVLDNIGSLTVHPIADEIEDTSPPMVTAAAQQSDVFYLVKRRLEKLTRDPVVLFATPSIILAAHVSPCGNHIAMLARNAVIVVHDFMRTGTASFPYGVHLVQLLGPAVADYLAFDGRIIAVGTSDGVLLLDVALTNSVYLRPTLVQTHEFSCVQLTRDALWMSWGDPGSGQWYPAGVLGFEFLGDPHSTSPDPYRFVASA